MAEFLMTHSLLSAWLYSMQDNPFSDATTEADPMEDFLKVLRREPRAVTEAMQNGIDFENLVTSIVRGSYRPVDDRWDEAARQIAGIVRGGILQLKAKKRVTVAGANLLLFGILDVLKAGTIFDIKFTKNYDRGKYFDSTQHPMYFELVPEADTFTYLPSNGSAVYQETYRREETPSIIPVISDFLGWLEAVDLMDVYREKWIAL